MVVPALYETNVLRLLLQFGSMSISNNNLELLEDLIHYCKQNNRVAQKKIFDVFSKPMLQVCYLYVKDYDVANDMLQDGFIKMFNKIHLYENTGSFRAWLKTIMINTCLNYLKKERKFTKTELNEALHIASNESQVFQKFELEEVSNAIKKLPEGCRKVINLYAIEGFSYKEIAIMLNVTEVNVRTQVSRARKSLTATINMYL